MPDQMNEEKLIPVNITVADRSYRLKIKPEEEQHVRSAIKAVNEKIIELKTSFAGKDLQDYIAMCLIMYATQSQSPATTSSAETDNLLQQLETMLDNALRQTV
jgi:cell division protein ZapA